MSETVVSIQSMPEVLLRLIKAKTVKIREENGVVTVIPIKEKKESPLRRLFGKREIVHGAVYGAEAVGQGA